jgi:hypothetical protein
VSGGDLSVTQIAVVKALVDHLSDLDISPLHLRIDAKHVGDARPDVSMWLRYRTDFERFCDALKLKAKERAYSPEGQREWWAEHDTADRRLLVQCVSFAHHEDWQPKERAA